MTSAVPYFREVGTGPGVVCLHSNASSSAQRHALMNSLAPTHQVLADVKPAAVVDMPMVSVLLRELRSLV